MTGKAGVLGVCQDLSAEADELRAFLETLAEDDWVKPTPFRGWSPWGVVAHLHFSDLVATAAATDPRAFADLRAEMIRSLATGVDNAEFTRREIGDLDAGTLLLRWHQTCRELALRLGASDPKHRLPWFGPDMGVRMFATARYMETWAHGQDIYDLMRIERTHTDRIEHVVAIGVKTFGWTFLNRGLAVPAAPPFVRLVAPSGAIWEWNEASAVERICGSAVDFCHVVTQGRNVADTSLEVSGETARHWMSIAQCFAGPPVDPPKPGERTGA